MPTSVSAFDAGQRLLLERIAQGAPLAAVLTDLVLLVEQQASGMACSILLVDAERGTVHPIATPSLPPAFSAALEGASIGPEAGSCGAAAYRKERVIVADIATHPYWRDYKALALPHGLRACWSTPIVTAERAVLGTFAMYYRQPREPTAIELSWVDAATHVATIAILRDRSERELRESEQRHRKLALALDERVKELTLIHNVTRLLQEDPPVDQHLLDSIAALVPSAFYVPELCVARVYYGELEAMTPSFAQAGARLRETFETAGRKGGVEVGYVRSSFSESADPFLPEERQLLRSLAKMLAGHFGRFHAVRALRESEERLRAVVEHTPNVAIQAFDAQGRMLWVNRASLALFGWSRERALGKTLDQLNFPAEAAARFMQSVREVEATGEPVGPVEFEFSHPDGRKGVLLSTVFRIPYGEGGSCFVCTDVDLTDYRSAREAARASEDARRALEERLIAAERLKGLGTLAGGIAHDFNNIITAVRGHTELALFESRDNALVRDSLEEVRNACVRANKLARQILTFGQRASRDREAVALRGVVDEALGLINATLPGNVALRVQIAPGAHYVWADATQVHQVLMNVATNAVQAMEGRAGSVEVALDSIEVDRSYKQLELAPGGYARLRVSDQGAGMSRETLARAFDPFFTTKAQGTGTGLGLSVVHGIMKSHDGAIAVETEVDRGTTFELYFPLASRDAVQDAVARPSEAHGEHVLYVDDDEALVVLTVRLLKRLGYRATGLTDSREALAAFREDPRAFDVVITDISMPRLGGPELAHEIKKLKPDARVILVSGALDPGASSALREETVVKPSTIEELSEVLQRALKRSAAAT